MNVWKLISPKKLALSEDNPQPQEGKLRVRVTKVLICGTDADIYSGALRLSYPLIPGRFAVGIVAEESDNELFPKGRRVLLHTFRPAPDFGTEKGDFTRCDFEICGQTADGFLRDVVFLSPEEMTPLPDSVSDESSLLLHHIALAKAALDRFEPQKGQHVAVVGANLFGIIACQLLIYQQAAPILIDKDAKKLDFARECGVYYTVPADDGVIDNVASLTGGRLTSGAIFTLNSKNDISLAFLACARESNVVLSGLPPYSEKMNLNPLLRKQICLHAVSDCSDYLETAINLMAQKAFNTEAFTSVSVRPEAAFAEAEDTAMLRYIDLYR